MAVPSAPVIRARNQGNGVIRIVVENLSATGATSYKLYRDDYPTAATTLLASGLTGPYLDATAADMDRYNYRVKGTNGDGDSDYSNTVSIRSRGEPSTGFGTNAKRINRTF